MKNLSFQNLHSVQHSWGACSWSLTSASSRFVDAHSEISRSFVQVQGCDKVWSRLFLAKCKLENEWGSTTWQRYRCLQCSDDVSNWGQSIEDLNLRMHCRTQMHFSARDQNVAVLLGSLAADPVSCWIRYSGRGPSIEWEKQLEALGKCAVEMTAREHWGGGNSYWLES